MQFKNCKKTTISSRSAVDVPKAQVVLFDLIVDVKATCDFVLEVAVDLAGVVLDLDLAYPWDTQQHVLIVDEGPLSTGQGLVVVPFSPVEAVQQGALGILSTNRNRSGTFMYGIVKMAT